MDLWIEWGSCYNYEKLNVNDKELFVDESSRLWKHFKYIELQQTMKLINPNFTTRLQETIHDHTIGSKMYQIS